MKVTMQSSVYGKEEFNYGTRAEALKGFARLKSKAKAMRERDGIRRTIKLIEEEVTI